MSALPSTVRAIPLHIPTTYLGHTARILAAQLQPRHTNNELFFQLQTNMSYETTNYKVPNFPWKLVVTEMIKVFATSAQSEVQM
jgi:hypothetical protein